MKWSTTLSSTSGCTTTRSTASSGIAAAAAAAASPLGPGSPALQLPACTAAKSRHSPGRASWELPAGARRGTASAALPPFLLEQKSRPERAAPNGRLSCRIRPGGGALLASAEPLLEPPVAVYGLRNSVDFILYYMSRLILYFVIFFYGFFGFFFGCWWVFSWQDLCRFPAGGAVGPPKGAPFLNLHRKISNLAH